MRNRLQHPKKAERLVREAIALHANLAKRKAQVRERVHAAEGRPTANDATAAAPGKASPQVASDPATGCALHRLSVDLTRSD